MFSKLVALSVLAIWLALIGIGYATSDNLDTHIVPSIVALDNQDYADDLDNYRPIDLAILPSLFFLHLSEIFSAELLVTLANSPQELIKPFQLNCALLL